MKVFFRRIHLYLALVCGVIIAITCLTGAILVFEKDLQKAFNKNRYYVAAGGTLLSADQVITNALAAVNNSELRSIRWQQDPERSVEVSVTQAGQDGNEKRLTVFMDPYSGEALEVYNHRESFWYWVMDLHRWMLGGKTGKWIVGASTIVFIVLLITGIILWWPRNKVLLKQRLRIKFNASFKRLNNDVHVSLGFYSAIFLFIFSFTGLAWSFEWFNDAIYAITGTKNERPPKALNLADSTLPNSTYASYLQSLRAYDPSAEYYSINAAGQGTDAVSATLLPADAAHESATTQINVDSKTGEILSVRRFSDRNLGQQVRATFKPVHIATIWGPFSKWIGFISCMLGFIFPITGYIMWYHRALKKKKNPLAAKRTGNAQPGVKKREATPA